MVENTDFRRYLASQILSHEKTTTYRVLSRALKVHVNTAKQMLYEYQRFQNDAKPQSVYATYLIYGTKREEELPVNDNVDGDVEMNGSGTDDDLEPLSDAVHTSTLTLAAEENLNDALSQYENVLSMHIYSLGPHPARDLQLLSDARGQLSESMGSIESVDGPKTYGTIANAHATKRTRQARGSMPSAAVPAKGPIPGAIPGKSVGTPAVKPEPKELSTTAPSSSAGSEKKSASAGGGSRGASGSIFQSFAKASAKKAANSKPKPVEDSPAFAVSDEGEDDDFPVKAAASKRGEARKSRQQRQDDLRRMMEEEEEEEDDTGNKASEREITEGTPDADSPMGDNEDVDQPSSQEVKKEKPEPAEVVSNISNGRRRGRRRVMKKKSVMDEEGYFVTVQEEAWESFSEDDAPLSQKPKMATPSSSSGSVKAKKSTGKGQGNIMSFFSKK